MATPGRLLEKDGCLFLHAEGETDALLIFPRGYEWRGDVLSSGGQALGRVGRMVWANGAYVGASLVPALNEAGDPPCAFQQGFLASSVGPHVVPSADPTG